MSVPVVILCGGKGLRSYPFTEYAPKVMMPIGGTPILVHLMRLYAQQGFSRFVLAAGHRMEVLADYFQGRFQEWGVQIVDTGDTSDTGERIRRCTKYLDGTFFATYGDGLGNVDLSALLSYHRTHGALATVTTVPLRSQYGTVVFGAGKRVERFIEKPVIPDRWINAGFFVFEPYAFSASQGQSLESDVLPDLAGLKQLYAYQHHGFWKSMDTSKDQQEFERLYAEPPVWTIIQPEEEDKKHLGADTYHLSPRSIV